MNMRFFLFGEAEKGGMCIPLLLRSLPELLETLGHPPEGSLGIEYAVQALLLKVDLIFFRVKEEGFSQIDYIRGVKLLYQKAIEMQLGAICIPGVGDPLIIEALEPLCFKMRTFLILTKQDLFDYLTASK